MIKNWNSYDKIIILGTTGFIAGAIYKKLSAQNLPIVELRLPDFDITKPETYPDAAFFNHSLIIDGITRMDASKNEIENVVVQGFRKFVKHVKCQKLTYFYFSSAGVLETNARKNNFYVHCKQQAEEILAILPDYKIARLVFPFGISQSKNRFMTRLIKKLKSNESLKIDQLKFNLTPISTLVKNIERILFAENRVMIISTNHIYDLPDIVHFLKKEIRSSSEIEIVPTTQSLYFQSDIVLDCDYNEVFNQLKAMI